MYKVVLSLEFYFYDTIPLLVLIICLLACMAPSVLTTVAVTIITLPSRPQSSLSNDSEVGVSFVWHTTLISLCSRVLVCGLKTEAIKFHVLTLPPAFGACVSQRPPRTIRQEDQPHRSVWASSLVLARLPLIFSEEIFVSSSLLT
jgi:hypothetical protein